MARRTAGLAVAGGEWRARGSGFRRWLSPTSMPASPRRRSSPIPATPATAVRARLKKTKRRHFMREHYTTGAQEAAAMAAYLASVGSDPRAVQQRRKPTLGAGRQRADRPAPDAVGRRRSPGWRRHGPDNGADGQADEPAARRSSFEAARLPVAAWVRAEAAPPQTATAAPGGPCRHSRNSADLRPPDSARSVAPNFAIRSSYFSARLRHRLLGAGFLARRASAASGSKNASAAAAASSAAVRFIAANRDVLAAGDPRRLVGVARDRHVDRRPRPRDAATPAPCAGRSS